MQPVNVVRATLCAAGALVCALPAQAQTEVGADLAVFSSYVWRGLSLTNKPVLEPAVYVSIPAGNASITLGGWSNIDLGKYDDLNDDIGESGGSSGFNFAEFDPYAEVSFPVGKSTITGGATAYIYPNSETAPNDFGLLTSDANTVEIYGKLGFDVPLSPQLSIYYDVDKIKGAYIEAAVSHSVAASEKVSIDLGATAGFSAGQGVPDDPLSDESSNFNDDGFTHLDLSAGLPFTAGALSIAPSLHVVINGDDRTKITSPSKFDKDAKLWGGVTISWSKAMGPQPEPESPDQP
jgi:Bacterial protein of unknown function (Gcw_chp)